MDTGQVVVGVLVILAAYLIGGIPWGVVIARLTGGPDPRTIGSGRTGGANVMRALGPRLALASGLLDVGKGVVAVLLAIAVGGGLPLEILAALAAIVGHSRSIWIGFAGGRGIAPAFGGLIVIAPIVALIVIPIFFGVLLISRYSSLASLTATADGRPDRDRDGRPVPAVAAVRRVRGRGGGPDLAVPPRQHPAAAVGLGAPDRVAAVGERVAPDCARRPVGRPVPSARLTDLSGRGAVW